MESKLGWTSQAGVRQVDARGRRWYTREFKATVVQQCTETGVSVAKVALKHGLNANLVRKWIRGGDEDGAVGVQACSSVALIPVALNEPNSEEHREDRTAQPMPALELRLGELAVSVSAGASLEQVRAIVQILR